jgi:F0F1-type ATP synthase alpha subunit
MILNKKISQVSKIKIIEKCKGEKPEIIEAITTSGKLDDEHEKILNEIILQLKKDFSA